jgi:hypothetical protein
MSGAWQLVVQNATAVNGRVATKMQLVSMHANTNGRMPFPRSNVNKLLPPLLLLMVLLVGNNNPPFDSQAEWQSRHAIHILWQ